MKYKTDYLSEFEQEFELDNEKENPYYEDSELEDDYELEEDSEFEDDSEFESEFEKDYGEGELEEEFESFEEPTSFEQRLYEVYTGDYESELEYENELNRVLYEMEQDFFFKKIGKFVKKVAKNPVVKQLANKALNAIPGKYGDLIRNGLKNPREFLKTAVKTFGPQLANMVVPGSGIALGALMGETDDYRRAAANATVAFAREAYSDFANEIGNMNLSQNPGQAQKQLNQAARNSAKKAYRTVKLGSDKHRFRKINRKVEDITLRGGVPGKRVTIIYKKV